VVAFNVGQIVKLKSGGPKMTIASSPRGDRKHYTCEWFAGSTNKSSSYPEAVLELAPEEKK
jgi:uncharacterized protein YodC (DUF2158 family)